MNFTLELCCDNDAFHIPYEKSDIIQSGARNFEVARILEALADKLRWNTHDEDGGLYDINGAKVGSWEFVIPYNVGLEELVSGKVN